MGFIAFCLVTILFLRDFITTHRTWHWWETKGSAWLAPHPMSCTEIFGFVLGEALCHVSHRPPKHNPAMFSHLSDALQAAADVVR